MAVTSKDIEILWGCYQSEGVSKGVSISQFLRQMVFVPTSSSSAQQATPVPSVSTSASLTVSHITICLSNGMRIDHHKLSFEDLVSFIKKLEPLCFA